MPGAEIANDEEDVLDTADGGFGGEFGWGGNDPGDGFEDRGAGGGDGGAGVGGVPVAAVLKVVSIA